MNDSTHNSEVDIEDCDQTYEQSHTEHGIDVYVCNCCGRERIVPPGYQDDEYELVTCDDGYEIREVDTDTWIRIKGDTTPVKN